MSHCASSSQVQVENFPVARSGLTLASGTAADHHAVFDLLQNVFQAPSAGDFQTQLEEPFYEPNQRLVARWGARVVSHLRMCHREMRFGSLVLPVSFLTELATAAPFRRQGLATALLAESERQMADEGTIVGFVRTGVPDFFVRRGWTLGGSHTWSEAGAREILAQLSATRPADNGLPELQEPTSRNQQLSTRIWRHVERAALERLYAANIQHSHGPLHRSHDYWCWLVSRRAYDAIYVTVQGPDRRELDDRPIVAYAVVRGSRVVELFGSPECPHATTHLLARICGEAIERDVHDVILDLAPDHPLHEVLRAAGGKYRRRELVNGQALLAKVLKPWEMLEQILPEIAERVRRSGLALPAELVIQDQGERRRIHVTRRAATLEPSRAQRQQLVCAPGALSELLLGQWAIPVGVERGRISSHSASTLTRAATFFPRLPLWRPPLEEMVV
jgi:predicted N-acetyltransferase YhbS